MTALASMVEQGREKGRCFDYLSVRGVHFLPLSELP